METLSRDFKGTLYSKVLLKTLGTDIIETSADARKADVKVRIEGKEYDSLYFDRYLKEKDKYAVYFGGNYAEVNIKTGASAGEPLSGEKLLIVKDSFANSMVPQLAEEYDRVLLVYSVNNFAKEKIVLTGSLLK